MNRTILRDFFLFALLCLAPFGKAYSQPVPDERTDVDSLGTRDSTQTLPEVTIHGTNPVVQMQHGAVTYDMPSLLKNNPADNAFEALGRIPGVQIQDGGVSFATRPVTLIINGKPASLSNEQVIKRLKSMPAELLDRAELMFAAPARYHAQGTVINIVTHDYSHTRQTAGQLQGVYQQGTYATGFASGDLLHTAQKFLLNANYTYSYGLSDGTKSLSALHPLGQETVPYTESTTNKTRTISHRFYSELDYQFAQSHRISVTYTNNSSHVHSRNSSSGSQPSRQFLKSSARMHHAELVYILPCGLQLTGAYMNYRSPKTQTLAANGSNRLKDLSAVSNQRVGQWQVTADQSHQLGRNFTLDYGVKAQATRNRNGQTTRLPDGTTVDEATEYRDYREYIYNGYAGISKDFGTAIHLEARLTGEHYRTPQWKEWHLLPSFAASWQVNPTHSLLFSFTASSQYPNFWSTMNSVSYNTAYTEVWGNPDLKPSTRYGLSLAWIFRNKYTVIAFADFEPNYFVQLPYQPADRLAVVMQEVNFNRHNRFGLQATTLFSVSDWLEGNLFLTGYYLYDRCDHFFGLPFRRGKVTFLAGSTTSARLSRKYDLRFSVNPFFQSAAIQGLLDIHPLFTLNASLRWTSANKKWMVRLSGNNLTDRSMRFQSVCGNQHLETKLRSYRINAQLGVTYRFGNYKPRPARSADTSRLAK